MISHETSVLEPAVTLFWRRVLFLAAFCITKKPKENQMGFQTHFNCWYISVWQLKDLIAIDSLFLLLHSTACKCNGHASVCNTNTGKCFCTTKGIKGDECQLWVHFTLLFEIKRPHAHTDTEPLHVLMTVFMISPLIFPTDGCLTSLTCFPRGDNANKMIFLKISIFKSILTANVMQKGWD